jgi:hypothetical protein
VNPIEYPQAVQGWSDDFFLSLKISHHSPIDAQGHHGDLGTTIPSLARSIKSVHN